MKKDFFFNKTDYHVLRKYSWKRRKKMKKNAGSKLMLCPSPLLLVATYDEEGKPDVMTVGWGGISNSNPHVLRFLSEISGTHIKVS